MGHIKRNLEKIVTQVTAEYPVVLVTGPRQVGKITMLQKFIYQNQHIFKNGK